MSESATIDYELISTQLKALLHGESDPLANSANFIALLNQNLTDINWCGIYVLRGAQLILGPFQGNPACVRIPLGQGVCGTAAAQRESLRVSDVHNFDGHIVCDTASRSELVIPLLAQETLWGVLDIDSPLPARFSADDQSGIELLCRNFVACLLAANSGFI